MNRRKSAFTLIELLVVIAIIAILAAILFPVFAQAKAAAKVAVGISNVKQLNLAMLIYSNDFDDYRVPRDRQDCYDNAAGQCVTVYNEYSWKQLIQPYVKNQSIYADPFNPASVFIDLHSDPVMRAFYNWTPVTLPTSMVFARGYAWADLWLGSNFQDDTAASMTMFGAPAGTFQTVETKEYNSDTGPFDTWTQNVDTQTTPHPTTGLQWNWGANKWENKAMGASFIDGHAKRIGFSAMCGTIFDRQPAGSSSPDYFNMSAASNPGTWADGVCSTLPTQFQ